MTKVFLFPLLFILNYSLLAQSVSISGSVKNSVTGLPLPYASIGISGKNLGTVTNEIGKFSFTVRAKDISSKDKIVFSCIGFEEKEFPIQIPSNERLKVSLKPRVVELKEVTVKPEKLKKRILGKNERHRLIGMNFCTIYDKVDDALGKERGMILKLNKDCFCNDFNIYIKTNYFSFIKFRLNFYDVKNGLPDSLLLKEDILFDVKDGQLGWLKVDLKKHNIFLEGLDEVAVTLQWIESKQARKKNFFTIPLSYPSIGHTMVVRDKSKGEWKTLAANMSMYFNADCYNRN